MAEWVRALACTGSRTGRVRIPLRTTLLRNFGNSVYPALPVSFGGDTKSRRSLPSGVYARGSKRSHQSALECVTVVDSTTHSKLPTSRVRLMWLKTLPCTCIGRRSFCIAAGNGLSNRTSSSPSFSSHFLWSQCWSYWLHQHSLLFHIILYLVQPSSLRSSLSRVLSFPSPSFLRSVPLFPSHVHTTSTSFPGLYFVISPAFVVPTYSFISYFV